MKPLTLFILALIFTVQPALAQTPAPPAGPNASASEALVSTAPDGSPANAAAGSPAASADGKTVAFVSTATNLASGNGSGTAQVYLRAQAGGEIQRISQSPGGDPADGWSYQPAISADGRLVAFTSLADNLVAGAGPGANVYAYDRSLGTISLVSQSVAGGAANGWSEWPTVSADGRFVVFMSLASDLLSDAAPGSDPGIYLRDLLFGTTQRLPLPAAATGWPYRPTISADGRWVAYFWIQSTTDPAGAPDNNLLLVYDRLTGALQSVPAAPGTWIATNPPQFSADGAWLAYAAWEGSPQKPYASLYLYDRQGSQAGRVPGSQVASASGLEYALAADGTTLFFSLSTDSGETLYRRYNLKTRQGQAIQPDIFNPPIFPGDKVATDQDGLILVYAGRSAGGQPQLYEVSLSAAANQPRLGFASGWVSDGLGNPMVGVQVSDERGHSAWSAADGSFRIDGIQAGSIVLRPQKKGYTFSPAEYRVPVNLVAATGLEFTASTDQILPEGRKDLGMPYDVQRGCPSPFKPCGGPYHGFYSGDCTDLIIDAYLASLDFNIQIALERDASQHPDHYYRWRNARSVQDMYRYFVYTQQLLPHSQPYLPGDIVFFDWEGDGIVDHVALISEVSASNRPKRMLDATGVTNDNPSGLAADLEWKAVQAQHVLGHARWLGQGTQKNQAAPQQPPYLMVALDSAQAGLRLLDASGLAIGAQQNQLVGGAYLNTGNGAVISLPLDAQADVIYFIELTAPAAVPYQLGIELVQADQISSVYSFQDQVKAGESLLIPVKIQQSNGKPNFSLPTLPGEPGPPGTPTSP
jgi:Tol biopolymer transport system component